MLGSLWFASFSAGGGAAASDYQLISTTVLGASQASVTFTDGGSWSSFKHLQLRITARDTSSTAGSYRMQMSGDTGSNYANHYVRGNGSTVISNSNAPANYGLDNVTTAFALSQSGAFGASITEILDFASTSKYKTIRALSGSAATSANDIRFQSAVWMSTSVISSITISSGWTAFDIGSRFSLYGIKG